MDNARLKPIAIEDEMRASYLDYAMSVIVARALPDVRDGLKPVHRRILTTLHDLGLTHGAHYRKSAKICGDVSGNYHPHGEQVVYPSMARLAQDFNMRYPLVDGQGNFGSVDGDSPAAMRYTEARMTAIAEEMLADIDKDTVDWNDNYDATRKEPMVLPSRIPNLLINGSSGIAVGMATNIPPHNLGEVCDALAFMVKRFAVSVEETGVPFDLMWARVTRQDIEPDTLNRALQKASPALKQKLIERNHGNTRGALTTDALLAYIDDAIDISSDELLEYVKGPDFPTGGIILGLDGIRSAYTTGRGRIAVRAKAHIEEARQGRFQIVVNELPYQVNKANLLEKIAVLVRDKRIEGISDLRDESDRQGMRMVIELKRDARPRQVLNMLFKHTAMQSAFSVNLLALVDAQPRTLTLRATLTHFLNHRHQVLTRRSAFDLEKARQRAHILEGLKIALDNLDEVLATIRRSRNADTARRNLMTAFKLTEIQATAILDMQFRRLAALERKKILDELEEVTKLVAYLEDLLANPLKILYLIRDEQLELKNKYGDERRTHIMPDAAEEITDEDLIPDQEIVIGVSQRGYVRRLPVETYRPRRKARGAGTGAIITREDDVVIHLMVSNTKAHVLFFTNRGRVYQVRGYDIPEATRQSRGLPLSNFCNIDPQEMVTASISVRSFDAGKYFVMVTRRGKIKRIELNEFDRVRANGLIAINLDEDDELRWVRTTDGDDDVLIATTKGQSIRFNENGVRPTGRNSGGVRGIRLGARDSVAGADVIPKDCDCYVITGAERGAVKRSSVKDYPVQGRGGSGVRGFRIMEKTGDVVTVRVAMENDEIMVATAEGTVYRSGVYRVPRMGRATAGIGLVRVAAKDKVIGIARLEAGTSNAPTAEDLELPGMPPMPAKTSRTRSGAKTGAASPKPATPQEEETKTATTEPAATPPAAPPAEERKPVTRARQDVVRRTRRPRPNPNDEVSE